MPAGNMGHMFTTPHDGPGLYCFHSGTDLPDHGEPTSCSCKSHRECGICSCLQLELANTPALHHAPLNLFSLMKPCPGTEQCAVLQYTMTSCVWSSVSMVNCVVLQVLLTGDSMTLCLSRGPYSRLQSLNAYHALQRTQPAGNSARACRTR